MRAPDFERHSGAAEGAADWRTNIRVSNCCVWGCLVVWFGYESGLKATKPASQPATD